MKGIDQLINTAERLRLMAGTGTYVARSEREELSLGLADIVFGLTKMRSGLESITGALALPIDVDPDELTLAIQICVRRCDTLERKVIELEDDDRPRSLINELESINVRLTRLEKRLV